MPPKRKRLTREDILQDNDLEQIIMPVIKSKKRRTKEEIAQAKALEQKRKQILKELKANVVLSEITVKGKKYTLLTKEETKEAAMAAAKSYKTKRNILTTVRKRGSYGTGIKYAVYYHKPNS